jgi:predicted lipid-binding transport protein (Tim44 family)
MTVDIIIFALIAIYIIIKLYNIIGSEDFESEQGKGSGQMTKVVDLAKDQDYVVVNNAKDSMENEDLLKDLTPAIASSVAKIKAKDNNFLLTKFLENSEKAFELIISAFSSNDSKSLKQFTSDEAQKSFIKSLDDQKSQNNTLNIDIVSFLEKKIKSISLKGNVCQISVNFVTEQIFYILDKDNQVIKGDKSKIERIEDNWVFEKNLKSTNPIWFLVKTQS